MLLGAVWMLLLEVLWWLELVWVNLQVVVWVDLHLLMLCSQALMWLVLPSSNLPPALLTSFAVFAPWHAHVKLDAQCHKYTASPHQLQGHTAITITTMFPV
jgi:hypothetical protein